MRPLTCSLSATRHPCEHDTDALSLSRARRYSTPAAERSQHARAEPVHHHVHRAAHQGGLLHPRRRRHGDPRVLLDDPAVLWLSVCAGAAAGRAQGASRRDGRSERAAVETDAFARCGPAQSQCGTCGSVCAAWNPLREACEVHRFVTSSRRRTNVDDLAHRTAAPPSRAQLAIAPQRAQRHAAQSPTPSLSRRTPDLVLIGWPTCAIPLGSPTALEASSSSRSARQRSALHQDGGHYRSSRGASFFASSPHSRRHLGLSLLTLSCTTGRHPPLDAPHPPPAYSSPARHVLVHTALARSAPSPLGHPQPARRRSTSRGLLAHRGSPPARTRCRARRPRSVEDRAGGRRRADRARAEGALDRRGRARAGQGGARRARRGWHGARGAERAAALG